MSFSNPELRSLCQAKFTQIGKDFEGDLAEAKRASINNVYK